LNVILFGATGMVGQVTLALADAIAKALHTVR
jgi:NADPH:quinone reductase-like Zn-dependent oxidoreductase